MKNLYAINPNDVDFLIGNYNKKINRNPILIYKEDLFPKINYRQTLRTFKKKQINIPMLMNNTFLEKNKTRFNSNFTESSIIIDKNAKNKKKYNPKDYLLSIKYFKFLKQEDLKEDNYFERIYCSESDSDDGNYMIEKLRAKKKFKEQIENVDFDRQLKFLMELDNIPKYILQLNAEKIVHSIENKKNYKTERQDLVIHNIYFDWILCKIYHQVEIRNKYNEKVSVQNVLNLLEKEITKTQNRIIKYIEEKKKLNEIKNNNLKKQSSLNSKDTQYDNEYNFFNKKDKSDYINYMRLNKKYKLNKTLIENLENSNENKDEKGKIEKLILEKLIKKKSQGRGGFLNKTSFEYSSLDKSDYSNNFNILNANKFLKKNKNNIDDKESLLSTFNSLLFPSKNNRNSKRLNDDWLSYQNSSILDETKRTTNTYNFKTSYDEGNKKFNSNFYIVNDDEEDNYKDNNYDKKLSDIVRDKITFNDEKNEKKEIQYLSDEEKEKENKTEIQNEDVLFGEKVIKRGKRKSKNKKGKKKKNIINNSENESDSGKIKKIKLKKNQITKEEIENNNNEENINNINNENNEKKENNSNEINNNNEINNSNEINNNVNNNEKNINNKKENNITNNNENQNNNSLKKSKSSKKKKRVSTGENEKSASKKNSENKKLKLKTLEKMDYEKNEELEKEDEKKKKFDQFLENLKKVSNYKSSFNPYIITTKRLNTREQNEFLRKIFFKKKEKEKIHLIPEEQLSKVKEEDLIEENKKLIRIKMGDEEMKKFIYEHSYLFNNKNEVYYDLREEVLNTLAEKNKTENESGREYYSDYRVKYTKNKRKKKKSNYYFEHNGLKLILNFDLNKFNIEDDDDKKKNEDEEERLRELSYEVRLKNFFEKIQKLKNEEDYDFFEKELDELIKEQIENSDMGKNKRRELNLKNFNEELNSNRKEKSIMKNKYGNLLFKNPCEFETKKI